MTLQVSMEDRLSLESYLVGYVHQVLNDIAESLADNDNNKAIKKTYEALEYLKQRLIFKEN